MQPDSNSWQHSLANLITDASELCSLLQLDPAQNGAILEKSSFPLKVSREFVGRIEPGNLNDPLLKQVLPIYRELEAFPGYCQDPLNEKNYNPAPGLLHKYPGRVLFTLTSGCAINCRFCFRRHFPYSENTPGLKGWNKALAYIAADSSIEEVIFSGGDPLVVKDTQLAKLVKKLEQIPHLQRLRIHTRMPIVIPSRITDELIQWLSTSRLQPVVVIHCNHPNEIDHEVISALAKLRQANINLLNQSVLLKGVNDNVDSLIELSRSLFANCVMPYYLHLLDTVAGASHFAVDQKTAVELMRTMTQKISGYLIPKLVREVAGKHSKVIIPF